MSTQFETGQIVKLKSGGPEMTVHGFSVIQGAYHCQWFAGKKLEGGYFPLESLIEVDKATKE
ncbi:TPA: YodC family protein [Serratia marcescens]|nr:DUF2158 domain-containing protein [Serratia marcescens]